MLFCSPVIVRNMLNMKLLWLRYSCSVSTTVLNCHCRWINNKAVRKADAPLGYIYLRKEQTKVMCALIEGRDVFVLLNGFGKSLCLPLALTG